MHQYSFPKQQKLCSHKAINSLFNNGRLIHCSPLRLSFQTVEQLHIKVLFSAPKKKFKKAVDRNLLKRRMREAFRLNSADLKNIIEKNNFGVEFAVIYTSSKVLPYHEIEKKMILLLSDFSNKINGINNDVEAN